MIIPLTDMRYISGRVAMFPLTDMRYISGRVVMSASRQVAGGTCLK